MSYSICRSLILVKEGVVPSVSLIMEEDVPDMHPPYQPERKVSEHLLCNEMIEGRQLSRVIIGEINPEAPSGITDERTAESGISSTIKRGRNSFEMVTRTVTRHTTTSIHPDQYAPSHK